MTTFSSLSWLWTFSIALLGVVVTRNTNTQIHKSNSWQQWIALEDRFKGLPWTFLIAIPGAVVTPEIGVWQYKQLHIPACAELDFHFEHHMQGFLFMFYSPGGNWCYQDIALLIIQDSTFDVCETFAYLRDSASHRSKLSSSIFTCCSFVVVVPHRWHLHFMMF